MSKTKKQKNKYNLYRASGLPLATADAEAFKTEFKKAFDALESTIGPASPDNVNTYKEELVKVEDALMSKFPRKRLVDIRELPQLLEEFQAAIAINRTVEDGVETYALYILDGQM